MTDNKKFAVIGGGSWATAIAKMLCVNLDEIAWYMRNEAAIEHLKTYKHNPNYLSSVEFDVKKLKGREVYRLTVNMGDIGVQGGLPPTPAQPSEGAI